MNRRRRLFGGLLLTAWAGLALGAAAQDASQTLEITLEDRADSEYGRKAFQEALPYLDKATGLLEQHESLPEHAWFTKDQKSNVAAINAQLDEAIKVLGVSEAGAARTQIRTLEERIDAATRRIADYREKRITAPANEESATLLDQYNPFLVTREEYDAKIAACEEQIAQDQESIIDLRIKFAKALRATGVDVTDEAAESLLATVAGDDFISMCVVFDNLKVITLLLQELTGESGEHPDTVKRYYGMYVIIGKILDRIQLQYLDTIRENHLPTLEMLTARARDNIDEAKRLMRAEKGDRATLMSNVEANNLTIEAAQYYAEYLKEMAKLIESQNEVTRRILATAVNTYKTVDVSVNVSELIAAGSKNLDRLMQLEMPKLRAYNNEALRREYERLNERIRKAS